MIFELLRHIKASLTTSLTHTEPTRSAGEDVNSFATNLTSEKYISFLQQHKSS